MPFLETILGQLVLGTGATAIWETGKAFLNRTSPRSVEDLFVGAFEQACNDLQNSPEYATHRGVLKFDDIAFRQLLRNEAILPSPSAASTIRDANYNEIVELLTGRAIIQVGDEAFSEDGYKQLIRNVVRYAQASFREALLEDEQGFRHLVSDTLAGSSEQLTEMAGLLERLDLPDIASSIRFIEAQTAQLSADVGYAIPMLEDIHRAVVREPASPTQPARLLFNVPRRNTYFTGRAELLQNLTTALDAEKPTAIVQAVQGLGGVGKSQLAIKYLYENADKYSIVGWVRAEDPSTKQADLSELSVTLGQAAESDSQSTKRSALNSWLASNQGWLLVFDNAVGPDEVAPYIPSSPGGKVLITSRARNWKNLATTLKVSTWERSESIEFIQKRLSGATDDEAGLIADLLDNLPLALEQAVAYMEQTGCGPVEYARLFEEEREELWGAEERPLDYKDTVATTWNVSINRIRQESEDAADMMNLLAYFAPEDIPLELLEAGAVDLPKQLSSAFSSTIRAHRIIKALTGYSLVDERNGFLSVHRLVQAVIRDQLLLDEQELWLSVALKLTGVNGSFLFDDTAPETWQQCAIVLPHAFTVVNHAEQANHNLEAVSELLNRIGLWYSHNLQTFEAVVTLWRALKIRESYADPLDPNLAPLLTDLGLGMMSAPPEFFLRPLGFLQEGAVDQDIQLAVVEIIEENRKLFERAIEIDRYHFTGKEPMRIAARLEPYGRFLRNLGCASRNRDLLDQGKDVQDEAYRIAKKEWEAGRITPERLARYINTQANTIRTAGNPERAAEKFEYALSFFEPDPATGQKHPDVAGIAENLAYTLLQLGRFDKAEREFNKSLAIREKFYPEGHPKLLETTFALAQTYICEDKGEEARKLLDMLPGDALQSLEEKFNSEVLPCFLLNPFKITVHEFLAFLKAKNMAVPDRVGESLSACEVKHNGTVYKSAFPVESIPLKGSDLCPCGSKMHFFECHKKEFQRALRANLTHKG